MARLSGYSALILFIISFFLAARTPILNQIFRGLQSQLRFHHWVAMLSVGAMLYHFCQIYWINRNNIRLIFDWSDIALLTGWITFVGIILIIPFAFYRVRIPYRKWRIIHLVSAVCLVTALFHTQLLFEPNKIIEHITFVILAIFALIGLFISVILPLFSFWGKPYLITELIEIRPKLFLLRIRPNSHYQEANHFQFDPGQFIYVKFLSLTFSRIWHPFTIISKPTDAYIQLFVKARGKDTEKLKTLSLPAPINVLAPFGRAFWKHDKAQLWIAYGVGAAIFLAAIRSFPNAFSQKIHFICCDSSINKIFFKKELDECMQQRPNFTWESYIGTGQQFVSEFNSRPFKCESFEKFRICGHPGFQKSLKSLLISRGIRKQNIQLEGLL